MSDFYHCIFELVKQIPVGMVTTYGTIALKTGNPRRSRVIGNAMAHCNDKNVPCHRVVIKDGKLPKNFGVGGNAYQRFLLEQEGVSFLNDGRVDMKKHFFAY